MQQFSALSVFSAGHLLENVINNCLLASFVGHGDDRIFNLSKPIDKQARAKAVKLLDELKHDCRILALVISGETVEDLHNKLSSGREENLQWLMDQLRGIRDLMFKEMKQRVYVYIPPEAAKYFTSALEPDLFGKAVAASFPAAAYDIREAGACIATMRPTAAVFHLMRILECGLSALGAVFGVSLEHTNWAPAIAEIEAKIRDMHKDLVWKSKPDHKDTQAKYARVASTFGVLKDGWRNYTMHGRNVYDLAETEHIFSNTKVLMQKLAALGLRE